MLPKITDKSATPKLTTMDVLYAINAKKSTAALNAPPVSTPDYRTTISIAQLLEYVNKLPQFSTRFRLLLLLRTKKGRRKTSFFRTEKERFGLRH